MLEIRSSAEMADALASINDVELKALLTSRRDQLLEYDDYDLGELVHIVVVDPGDAAGSVSEALGFDPTANAEDRIRLGEPGFDPSWETLEHHAGWTEVVFVLSDDGFGCVLLIPDVDGVDPSLSSLCRAHA